MQQFNATKQNGVTLAESKTIAIYDENIVSVVGDSDGNAEIDYAHVLDRRIKPIKYTVTNTYATVAGLIGSDKLALTVYDVNDGTTSAMTLQQKFAKEIIDTYAMINNTKTACREVTYHWGAFATKKVYVSNSLASLATAVVTTTTTAAPTTTTTAAPTTTTSTTTAAATTTTTA